MIPQYNIDNLTLWDLLLTPIFVFVLYYIGTRMREKRYKHGHPLRKYFMPALMAKMGGAIFIGLIYNFYYAGGDTYNYHFHARVMNTAFLTDPGTWWDMIMQREGAVNPKIHEYSSTMFWYRNDAASFRISIIASLMGLFNGTSYMPTALLFAFFSFTGVWALFRTFVNLYPSYHKALSYSILFLPSVVVWGSGLFKDTVCLFSLGWLVYTTFRVFINRDFTIKNISLLVFSFYLLATIKIYILIAFIPALSLWLLLTYSKKISSKALRWIANIVVAGIVGVGALALSSSFAEELDKYSLDKIATTSSATKDWIAYVTEKDQGSGYDLGEFEPTLAGMATKFPAAVNVTLFRPYIWEVRKPIVFLSGLEAAAFLGFFIYCLFKVGPLKFFKKIFTNNNLLFFFVFTLIFAFAVGISSYNFGALSRYRIPCLPFFASLLLILYRENQLVNMFKKHEADLKRMERIRL